MKPASCNKATSQNHDVRLRELGQKVCLTQLDQASPDSNESSEKAPSYHSQENSVPVLSRGCVSRDHHRRFKILDWLDRARLKSNEPSETTLSDNSKEIVAGNVWFKKRLGRLDQASSKSNEPSKNTSLGNSKKTFQIGGSRRKVFQSWKKLSKPSASVSEMKALIDTNSDVAPACTEVSHSSAKVPSLQNPMTPRSFSADVAITIVENDVPDDRDVTYDSDSSVSTSCSHNGDTELTSCTDISPISRMSSASFETISQVGRHTSVSALDLIFAECALEKVREPAAKKRELDTGSLLRAYSFESTVEGSLDKEQKAAEQYDSRYTKESNEYLCSACMCFSDEGPHDNDIVEDDAAVQWQL
mmetsp:Transcript_46742/g.141632  ORF Transcript_46742/g.141632 Transcript_46742/m.141632 type:complete len:360 (-) Transcript_46742:247-1326(-)